MKSGTDLRRKETLKGLNSMSPAAVRRRADEVLALLGSRSPLVRIDAVEALERADIGAAALRATAMREKNDLVLAIICEALFMIDDSRCVPILRKLARSHWSALVRRKAAWGLSEILGPGAVAFLRERERSETSNRVRVAIRAALVKNGDRSKLPALLKMLHSRDPMVRASVAYFFVNNLTLNKTDRERAARCLRAALEVEQPLGVAEAITAALARLQGRRPKGLDRQHGGKSSKRRSRSPSPKRGSL
jgi:HEAT repeat protein